MTTADVLAATPPDLTTGEAEDVARTLFISPKTAGTHIEHIYTKIGVSSRAAATLFAVEHGLLT